MKLLFNKEIKFISFEVSNKHVQVHSVFLLYLSLLSKERKFYMNLCHIRNHREKMIQFKKDT